jgi:hypothetical protein
MSLRKCLQAWKENEMHLNDGELRAYLDHELDKREMERASLHLSACPDCQARFQAVEGRAHSVRVHLDSLEPATDRSPLAANAARKRLEGRLKQSQTEVFPMLKNLFSRRARPVWAALAVIAILAIALAVPSVRAIANNFLGLFRVQQFSVIQVDESQLESQLSDSTINQMQAMFSDSVSINGGGAPVPVASPVEASQQSGFGVRLPAEAPAQVSYEVQPGLSASMPIDVRQAQAILDELGHSDVRLPNSLDGQIIEVDIPTAVVANYGDCQAQPTNNDPDGPPPIKAGLNCVNFVQVPSPTISAPPDLDINQLGQAMLEVLGMSPEEAAQFAQNIDWTSTLVVPVPRYRAQYEEVQVDGVQGTLLSSAGGNYALLWVKNGIVYAITGQGNKQGAVDMANSIP